MPLMSPVDKFFPCLLYFNTYGNCITLRLSSCETIWVDWWVIGFLWLVFSFTARPHACNAERCISHGDSVCPSHAGIVPRRMKIGSCGLHYEVAKTLVFWYQQRLRDDISFRLKFALKVTYPSEKRQLRPIYAYNVSTIRASEKSSIIANRKSATHFPTNYRRSAYGTSNSSKGWLK